MTVKEVLGSVAAQKFRDPYPANEGNWKTSQLFCSTLADALSKYGNDELPKDFHFVIEPYLNNIMECALSERTQLSVSACRLVAALPKVLGRDMHPLLDRIIPSLLKHCASTKAVNQKSASAAISNIVAFSTYSNRILWHVTQAFDDKNVGPRIYAPGWLDTILENYYRHLNVDRDFDAISRAITTGLLDADATVRTNSRGTFWTYHKLDPAGTDKIKAQLNNHAKLALESDPHNPEKKNVKTKPKKSTEPDPGLAELRAQAKKRMQERMAEQRNRNITPHSIVSTDFVFGPVDNLDAVDPPNVQSKSSSLDQTPSLPPKHGVTRAQQDGSSSYISSSRPIPIHRKGLSHDEQTHKINKKPSTAELAAGTTGKKPGSSDGPRSSQHQHKRPESSAGDSQGARPLLSAPVRRPRIVATPINATQSNSRPSSRLGQTTSSQNSDVSTKQSKGSITSSQDTKYPTPESISSSDLQPIKITKKASRAQISSTVIVSDGKENAAAFAPKSVWEQERQPSPVRKPLEVSQIQQRDFTQTTTDLPPNSDLIDARKAFKTGLELLQTDRMDYMGFRKLKKLVCNYGEQVIIDQKQYDTLFTELLPKLGTVEELVFRGDPQDMKHPTYIRQAITHMILTLISNDFPTTWRERHLGGALSCAILARCCYTPNTKENQDSQQTHAPAPNSTVDLLIDAIDQIIYISQQPLQIMDTVLETLSVAETFMIENCAELDKPNSGVFASFDRYRVREDAHLAQLGILSPPNRYDNPNEKAPRMPSKMPFFMETNLKVVSRLLEKARKSHQPISSSQEDNLADLAVYLLTTYSVLIRYQVMLFCKQLFLSFSSIEKFWSYFESEGDRNLLHYYLADSNR